MWGHVDHQENACEASLCSSQHGQENVSPSPTSVPDEPETRGQEGDEALCLPVEVTDVLVCFYSDLSS